MNRVSGNFRELLHKTTPVLTRSLTGIGTSKQTNGLVALNSNRTLRYFSIRPFSNYLPGRNTTAFSNAFNRCHVRPMSTNPGQQFQDLNPKKWGYDEAYVRELYLGIQSHVDRLPDSAKKILSRTGIDGMSLGALNAPAWYGLVLFSNCLRLALNDKVHPLQIDPSVGFTHTAGEGGIPNTTDYIESSSLLRGPGGEPLIEYCAELFKPQIFQYASGQFLKNIHLENYQAELKGGQSAKDAIGGRIPFNKNTETVSYLRGIDKQIDVPSPNNVPTIKSVEELILWRIFMEELTGRQPIIKVSTAYNFVSRALAVARAGAILNVAGGQHGRTGGTAASEFDIRDNTIVDGFSALRALREAFDLSGLDVPIHFSNNFYTPEHIILGLMLADKVKFGTSILIWLEQCVYAKQCHNNCPKNITTSPEKFNNQVLIDQLPAFFKVFEDAAEIAKQLGVTDSLDQRFDSKALSKVLKSTNNTDFAKWLSFNENSDGSPISKKVSKSTIPSQKSQLQKNDEVNARFTFTETGKKFINLKGSSGAIGFFASLQRDAKQFLDRQFIVQNGGTYFGAANQGLDLYSTQVSDFAGNLQNEGAITVYSAGRQFGVGLQGGNLHAAHVDSEVGYRMGTATLICETAGDSAAHYVGRGQFWLLGQAHDYSFDGVESNNDAPIGRIRSLGINPFAASAGGTFIVPRQLFIELLETNQIMESALKRLTLSHLSSSDKPQLLDDLNRFQQKMFVLGEDRKIAKSLIHFIKSSKESDLNEQFVKLKTAKDFSTIDPNLMALLKTSQKLDVPIFKPKNYTFR